MLKSDKVLRWSVAIKVHWMMDVNGQLKRKIQINLDEIFFNLWISLNSCQPWCIKKKCPPLSAEFIFVVFNKIDIPVFRFRGSQLWWGALAQTVYVYIKSYYSSKYTCGCQIMSPVRSLCDDNASRLPRPPLQIRGEIRWNDIILVTFFWKFTSIAIK